MLGKDALGERLTLHELHRFKTIQPAGGQRKATDAAEGVDHADSHHYAPKASARLPWHTSRP
jgi:hypothetical protein